IVLGESILAASFAIQSAIQAGDVTSDLTAIIVGGLLIVFAMWWLYFDRPTNGLLTSLPRAFVCGYGHYAIFASAAAVGAGLGVAVDHATRHAEIGSFGASAAVAVPVAIYLLGLWALHVRLEETSPAGAGMTPIVAFLVLLTPWTGQSVPLTGLLVSGLLAVKVVKRHQETARTESRPRSL
ncbi:MAG TPA: low temperature requirement protein A, partial [Gemmatimonadota bacterium]|nr:low temperature requirement protein A [Gemmatimonadota bacterium]